MKFIGGIFSSRLGTNQLRNERTPPLDRRWLVHFAKDLIDVLVFIAAFGLAFLVRFEGSVPAAMARRLVIALPAVVLIKSLGFRAFRVSRHSWRYVGLLDAERIFSALALASGVLAALRLIVVPLGDSLPLLRVFQIPLGVLAIDNVLCVLGAVGVRACRRLHSERWEHRKLRRCNRRVRTLLVGAGYHGIHVARQLASQPDMCIEPVGFVNDDPRDAGLVLGGVPVLGSIDQIRKVIEQARVEQVVITASARDNGLLRRVISLCEGCGVPTKLLPDVCDVTSGIASGVRDVAIEDLLGRAPVELSRAAIADTVGGCRVLVTGAGGSIGSELCLEIGRFAPALLVLVERAENNLFCVERELRERFPTLELAPCLGDICDVTRMREILQRYQPAIVFHAAAHKHVPMMEQNPTEAVRNNVLGTRSLADLVHNHNVAEFVMISTDKAVNPASVMGVSKRVAEQYIQALSEQSLTRFVTVRFGNVLGSSGSVIPIFKDQIRRGGPVTVTHPAMERFFMTIPEACQLVLEAASLGRGGEIFILDMGKPVKIVDLARDLIRLSGLAPDQDIELRFTGIRPGEKLTEELALEEEKPQRTRHPRIFSGRLQSQNWQRINRLIDELSQLASTGDAWCIRAKLKEIVPEYRWSPCDTVPGLEPGDSNVTTDGLLPAVAPAGAIA